jgi:TolB-like protein/Tfp pilus assembly protein PilF
MRTPTRAEGILRFGAFELDGRAGELRKRGLKIKLQEQPLCMLQILVESAGSIVSREELRTRLWPSDTFVDFDVGLNKAVNKIRVALGDSADNPRFIETVPRRGYRFLVPVDWNMDAGGRPGSQAARLAILPLDNFSGDPSQEYFSDGLTEELITQLGGLAPERLGVIARSSVSRYKKGSTPIAEIGRELGVDFVVEGSVRRADGRVRISAQLIRVSDQMHVWAESYERAHGDILLVQEQVANAIARQICVLLAPQEEARLRGARTVDPRAHEACLVGRHHFARFTGDGWKRALASFEEAVAADPTYAPGYTGLADCYSKFGQFGFLPPSQAFSKARDAALRALELDSRLAEAHASLALITFLFDWDWPAAREGFRRSIGLNPNLAISHAWYSFCLVAAGEPVEAGEEIARALELEPLGSLALGLGGWHLLLTGDTDSAVARMRKAVELHPESFVLRLIYGLALLAKPLPPESIEELLSAEKLSGHGFASAYRAVAHVLDGQPEQALKVLSELREAGRFTYVPSILFGTIHYALGETEVALDWFERACDERESNMLLMGILPLYRPLHPHPRFQAILKRTGVGCSA